MVVARLKRFSHTKHTAISVRETSHCIISGSFFLIDFYFVTDFLRLSKAGTITKAMDQNTKANSFIYMSVLNRMSDAFSILSPFACLATAFV